MELHCFRLYILLELKGKDLLLRFCRVSYVHKAILLVAIPGLLFTLFGCVGMEDLVC